MNVMDISYIINGGNESIDNISIVKMIPYIDMNVQMIDVFERADKL